MSPLIVNGKSYIRPQDVAANAGISADYISRLCRAGDVDGKLVEGVWHVNEQSLAQFIARKDAEKRERAAQHAQHLKDQRRKADAFARQTERVRNIPQIALLVLTITLLLGTGTFALSTPVANSSPAIAAVASVVPAPVRATIDRTAASVYNFFCPFVSDCGARASFAAATSSTSTTPTQQLPARGIATTTAPQQPQQIIISQPVIERVIENVRTVVQSGIDAVTLDARFAALSRELEERFNFLSYQSQRQASDLAEDLSGTGGGGFDDIDITGSTFTGGSISGASINGGSLSGVSFLGGADFTALTVADATSTNASSTNLYVSGSFGLGTGTGVLQASSGVVSPIVNGSVGQVLKIVGGVPTWSADLTGGSGGGAGTWATTSDSLAVYPSDPTQVVIVGGSATTTNGNIFEVAGASLFRGSATAYGLLSAPRFTATSSVASIFPYASTTAISATTLCLSNDCRSAWPIDTSFSTTSVEYWKSISNFFSTTSADYWEAQQAPRGIGFATTSANYWQTTRDFFSTTSALHFSSLGLAYSTTSADAWKDTRNFFSTTSASYFASVGLAFSTTSSDFWQSQRNFFATTSASYWKSVTDLFSTTSASYFLSQNQGAAFSTSSASYFLVQYGSLGFSTTSADFWKSNRNFFATSSADYWRSVTDLFSTTSSNYLLSTYDKGFFFSTTSADAWKDSRNFFSTSSAQYFSSLGLAFSTTSADAWKLTRNFFATSSADYWKSVTDLFSTTSVTYFAHSSTTIPKTYTANTFTALQNFSSASSTQFTTTGATYLATSGGNVGIGTTSLPTYAKLEINTTGSKGVHTMDQVNGGLLLGYEGAHVQGRTTADANGNLFLNAFGGNVGIGTESPSQKLDVVGSNALIRIGNDTSNAGTVGIQFSHVAAVNDQQKAAIFSAYRADLGFGRSDLIFALNSIADTSNVASSTDAKMIIKNSGNVGIGTTTPPYTLTIAKESGVNALAASIIDSSTAGTVARFSNYAPGGNVLSLNVGATGNTLGANKIFFGDAVAYRLGWDTSTGNVGIATTSPWKTLSIVGTMAINGLTLNTGAASASLCLSSANEVTRNTDNESCITSSARYKHDIQSLIGTTTLKTLLALRPVSFEYNETPGVRYGLIAEEVNAIDPTLVGFDDQGRPNSVRYTSVIPLLIQSLKDLIHQVRDLATAVANFAERITTRELCVKNADGTDTCVTGDQLAALLSQSPAPQVANPSPPSDEFAPESATSSSSAVHEFATSTEETNASSPPAMDAANDDHEPEEPAAPSEPANDNPPPPTEATGS